MSVQIEKELRVQVRYPAAEDSFRSEAKADETVGHLKHRVLEAFDLAEGQNDHGDTVTYTLYHEKTALENQNQTLGEVAGHHHELTLKLAQQITQG